MRTSARRWTRVDAALASRRRRHLAVASSFTFGLACRPGRGLGFDSDTVPDSSVGSGFAFDVGFSFGFALAWRWRGSGLGICFWHVASAYGVAFGFSPPLAMSLSFTWASAFWRRLNFDVDSV